MLLNTVMKNKVPRVNISHTVSDIKLAQADESIKREIPEAIILPAKVASSLPRRPLWLKILGWTSLGLAVLAFAAFGTGFYYLKYRLPGSVRSSMADLQSVASEIELPGFEFGIGEIVSGLNISPSAKIFGILGDIRNLASDFSVLAAQTRTLSENWPEFIFGGKGEELIAALGEIRNRISSVYGASERLREVLGFSPWGTEHLLAQVDLVGLMDFLNHLVPWLDSDEPRRILVLLQNPSELRPGGGFIGSYAEVELRRGNAVKVKIRDINDADRESALKIVPPRQLQLIAKRWRAADANWFFDFSDSAEHVLKMFGKSDGYDAVFGVSASVIGDILRITGRVEIPGRGLALDGENFLTELQKQVQTGRAEGNDNPKDILSEFAPLLINKIVSMDGAAKAEFASRIAEWLERKDIQIYSPKDEFQKFFESLGAAGRVFRIPESWKGDYLAVVSGNIGGGKSDLYVRQKIVFQSQINSDGTLSNRLVVRRRHFGNESGYWWYRAPNESYLKVFVPVGAKLTYANGGNAKKILPKLNYVKEGYAKDPLISAIEESREIHADFETIESFLESGKKVFATWVKTDAGKTSEIVLNYSRRLPFLPGEGVGYEFVFERQSGAEGEYSLEINAPVGFRFRENGLPLYEYRSSDPPGRLILNLTLESI